jgi:hypothetical protein
MNITCELQDLEELMQKAGVLLTGDAYDTAQDYLQDNCACSTYQYLLGYKASQTEPTINDLLKQLDEGAKQ